MRHSVLPRPRLPFPGDERYADREEQVGILCAHHGYTLDQAVAEVHRREEIPMLIEAIQKRMKEKA